MNKFIKQAFTLIELLVVIAIIGILSGLIVVSMSGVTQKATIAKSQIFSNSLRNSLMANIVGEWKFDGPTSDNLAATPNDVLDTWGGINSGAIPASPAIPTVRTGSNCVSGSCLSFDGGDYISVSNNSTIDIKDKISIGAWIYPKGPIASAQDIICKSAQSSNAGYEFRINTNMLEFRINPTSSSFVYKSSVSNNFSLNKWYYVSVSYDGISIVFYKDGQVFDTIPAGGQLYNSNSGLRIGAYIIDGSYYFNGLIDDVRIYNAAISTSQIKEQYFAGLNKLLASGGITQEEYQNRIGELAIR